MAKKTVKLLGCFFCDGTEQLRSAEDFPNSPGLSLKLKPDELIRLDRIMAHSKKIQVSIQVCQMCLLERAIDTNQRKRILN